MSPSRTRATPPNPAPGTGANANGDPSPHSTSRPKDAPDVSIRTVIAEARAQLQELTGRSTEAVTSVERDEEGWRLSVEVVELERIPASTSILGVYDVRVDRHGNLLEYARTSRYHRNQAGEADQ